MPGSGELGAECATLGAPLDHADPDGATVQLALKRLPATSPRRGQLWFLTGGPGDAGTWDIAKLDGVAEQLPDLDLITLDVRGVGRSTPLLDCPRQQHVDSPDGHEVVAEEWVDCVEHLRSTHGELLPYFTTTQTARDVLLAVDATRQSDDAVLLWGVSYGSFLANRVLQLRPEGWSGVVLDGLVPWDWSFETFDANLDNAARRHLALCADQPDCRDHLGDDPEGFAEDLLARLALGHCRRLGLDADLTRLVHGVLLMGGEPVNTLVPPMLARLDRCKARDIRAFVSMFDELFPEEGGGMGEERSGHQPVLQRHIAMVDLWPTGASVDPASLDGRVAGSIATTRVSVNFAETAAIWPTGPEDALAGRPASTAVPMLMLHGGLDPTMPMVEAARFFEHFDGPNQIGVAVPHAFHVTFNSGDCPVRLTLDFFACPTAPVDTRCVEQMPAVDFSSAAELHQRVWGTADRWGARRR